jgi:hypothetical protein
MRLILLLTCFACSAYTQDNLRVPLASTPDSFSAGYTNGRGWAAMPIAVKVGYIVGFSQGTEYVKNGSHLLPTSLTFGEIALAIDAFYKDSTNAPMPVPFAIRYVKRKAEGATEAELNTMQASFRKMLSDLTSPPLLK